MNVFAVLVYIGGSRGVSNLTPEERAMALWIFAAIFSIAIGAAVWTFMRWKKKRGE